MNKISVIIPTKDRIQDITRCLESIFRQTLLPYEIVVVDGSSTQELNKQIKLRFGEKTSIKYIHSQPGLTRQRNVGIKASSGDIILFLDDDTILDKDYIREIIRIFHNYVGVKIGGVTGNVIRKPASNPIRRFLAGGGQALATVFLLGRFGDGKFQPSGIPTAIRDGSRDRVTNVEFLCGCNMAFRREIFNEFQFDEKMHSYMFMEDDDFAYRVSRKYQNIWVPQAKLIHNVSPVARNRYVAMKNRIRNHFYLFKKNLPQTPRYKLAFYWSVVGTFIMEAMLAILKRDGSGVRGLTSGMVEVIKKDRTLWKV